MMDIADMVILSRLTPRRKNLPFAFHPGFMFFPSPQSTPPVEQKRPLLLIWRNPAPKNLHHCLQEAEPTIDRSSCSCLYPKNLLTNHDVEKDILVFDGGDSNNPPIEPPGGVNW
jgi:hypothetical protein